MTRLQGCGTALVTPFTERGAVDFAGAARAGGVADRRGDRLPGALRVHRRGADAGRRRARAGRGDGGGGRRGPGAGDGGRHQQRHRSRRGRDPPNVPRRRRLHPHRHSLLQQAHPGRTPPALQRRRRCLRQAGLPLQRTGPHGRQPPARRTRCSSPEHPNVIGIKEASGDLAQIMEILAGPPGRLRVLSGDDWLTLAVIAAGGDGLDLGRVERGARRR